MPYNWQNIGGNWLKYEAESFLLNLSSAEKEKSSTLPETSILWPSEHNNFTSSHLVHWDTDCQGVQANNPCWGVALFFQQLWLQNILIKKSGYSIEKKKKRNIILSQFIHRIIYALFYTSNLCSFVICLT